MWESGSPDAQLHGNWTTGGQGELFCVLPRAESSQDLCLVSGLEHREAGVPASTHGASPAPEFFFFFCTPAFLPLPLVFGGIFFQPWAKEATMS